MRIVADTAVVGLARRSTGRVYVWCDEQRCCSGAMTYLRTADVPPPGRTFTPLEADGFELWLDVGSRTLPAELVLEVRGRKRPRIEAYWNGCAFVI